MTSKDKKTLLWLGCAGLLGSTTVGLSEWLMQFTTQGKLDLEYSYFDHVSQSRLTFGHFVAVLTGPLYFLGYMHLGRAIDRSKGWLGRLFTGLGIYSFAVGIAWIGGRVYLAIAKKSVTAGESPQSLLQALSEHNEPFVNVLRVAILLLSVLWVYAIVTKRSYYPRWMALLSPIVLLISIFLTYFLAPKIGKYLLPTAMNLTHFTLFALSLYHCARIPVEEKIGT